MENKVNFDMGKVQFEPLEGKCEPVLVAVPDFKKTLCEFLYYSTSNLGLRAFSLDLIKSDSVSVNRAQLEDIKQELPKMKILNPILHSINSHIESLLAELDGKITGEGSKRPRKNQPKIEK